MDVNGLLKRHMNRIHTEEVTGSSPVSPTTFQIELVARGPRTTSEGLSDANVDANPLPLCE
jgi:hypothetical protein